MKSAAEPTRRKRAREAAPQLRLKSCRKRLVQICAREAQQTSSTRRTAPYGPRRANEPTSERSSREISEENKKAGPAREQAAGLYERR